MTPIEAAAILETAAARFAAADPAGAAILETAAERVRTSPPPAGPVTPGDTWGGRTQGEEWTYLGPAETPGGTVHLLALNGVWAPYQVLECLDDVARRRDDAAPTRAYYEAAAAAEKERDAADKERASARLAAADPAGTLTQMQRGRVANALDDYRNPRARRLEDRETYRDAVSRILSEGGKPREDWDGRRDRHYVGGMAVPKIVHDYAVAAIA